MSKKLLLGIIVLLLITNIMTLLFWNNDEKVAIDESDVKIDSKKPVASINDQDISYEIWMRSLRQNDGKSRLKTLIDRELVKQLAKQNNIGVSEKVIEREIASLTTMQGVMTEEETKQKEKKWRKDILYRYQLTALLTKDVSIPEHELQTYFNGYHNQYDFKASIQVSHIVVPDFDTAKKVESELDEGASFALLAKEYSNDEETKNDGGYLGFFVKTSQFLPNGYAETAQNMDERSYSKPFKSGAGISIIYLHRKLPSITFTYDEIKPYIEDELALGELDQTLTADPFWDDATIEWVYE